MEFKSGRGGKREGAGRKAGSTTTQPGDEWTNVRMRKRVREAANKQAKEAGFSSASEYLEFLVLGEPAVRDHKLAQHLMGRAWMSSTGKEYPLLRRSLKGAKVRLGKGVQ